MPLQETGFLSGYGTFTLHLNHFIITAVKLIKLEPVLVCVNSLFHVNPIKKREGFQYQWIIHIEVD